jgi:hypothetical protein
MPVFAEFSAVTRRARDWSPLEPTFKSYVSAYLKQQPTTKTAESTGALDRSLGEYWKWDRQSVTYGNPVEYAIPHDAWRKKKGKPPVMLISKRLQTAMLDQLADYILTGRTR